MSKQTHPIRDARIRVVVADDQPVIRGMVRSVLDSTPILKSAEKLRTVRKR